MLRAVMVGPADTPYHDGLFFFDIKLPKDYPAAPPQVPLLSTGPPAEGKQAEAASSRRRLCETGRG